MSVTNYVWDEVNDSLLMETDENGDTTAEYTQEPGQFGGVVSERRDGQSRYYHYDGLGSTRQLTDAAGQVTDRYLYDAFGNTVQTTGSTVVPYHFVGRSGYYHDAELLQYYVRARHYAPALARWLSVDPLDSNRADGEATRSPRENAYPYANGDLGPRDSYVYVANSPVSLVDPFGLEKVLPGAGATRTAPCMVTVVFGHTHFVKDVVEEHARLYRSYVRKLPARREHSTYCKSMH